MSSTTTTSKVRRPRNLVQRVDGNSAAKLQQFAVDHRLANLVKRDATHFLRRQSMENWLRQVEAVTLPMGPALLPKTRKNIATWRALTPAQQADRKARAITKARAEVAEAKAKRQATKQEATS